MEQQVREVCEVRGKISSRFTHIFIGLFLVLALVTGCSGKGNPSAPVPESVSPEQKPVVPAWPALAQLDTGDNPLWFELGPDGPKLIDSPAAADLVPYAPWPSARFISGIQAWDAYLVLAVNRDGFLVLGAAAETDAVMLYRVSSGGLWDPYTAESLFSWEGKPAVLLYRNDFFADPAAPSPRPQVYVLERSSAVPLGAAVPALEAFPSEGPWEAEVVQRGPDGFWYYRMKEKGTARNETAYFRTGDLGEKGEKISVGDWRDSDLPEGPENAPALLAAILHRAQPELDGGQGGADEQGGTGGQGGAGPGQVFVVRAVSPDFEGPRFFSSARISSLAGNENSVLLYGYCREKSEPLALAILGDGRGLCVYGSGEDAQPFSLPSLPDGFVYTGAALLGNVLAASWEEQQEAGIGAAGFMVMKMRLRQ